MQIADTVIVIIIWLIEMPSKRCRQYDFFYCAARTPAWAYGLVQTVSNFSFAIWFGLGWVAFCSGLDWFGLEKHISRLKLVWVECTVALVWVGLISVVGPLTG